MRLVHQRYAVYVDGTLHPTKATLLIDDRNAKTLVLRESGNPDIFSLAEVELLSEKRERRLHQLTWIGTDAEGAEITVTGIKRGCGCGGR